MPGSVLQPGLILLLRVVGAVVSGPWVAFGFLLQDAVHASLALQDTGRTSWAL